MLTHARLVGLALLAAAVLVRFAGRALGRFVLLGGAVASAYLAWREWQTAQSWMVAGGVLLLGLALSALAAWIIRAVSFVLALALFVAAWYVVLYGWMGADFVTTTVGSMIWVAAAILSMMATNRLSLRAAHRVGLTARVATAAMGGVPGP